MALSPTSRLSFLTEQGRPLDAPPEWTRALVAIDCDPADWQLPSLLRNGVACSVFVKKLDGQPRVLVDWPLSGAGHYELTLSWDDGSWAETRLCSITPRKLLPSETDQMLVDLQQRLPASIAIALQRAGALSAPSSRRFLRVRSQSLAPELAVIPADRVRAFRSSRLSLRCTLMVTPHDRGKGHRRIPRRSANQITREFMLSTDFKPPPRHRGDRAIRPAAAGEQGTDRPDARSQAETYLGCLFDAAPPETFIELRWRV